MQPLAWQIRRAGYATQCFGYRSLLGSIERHASRFGQFIRELDTSKRFDQLHIVAHSMGSIVTRQALLRETPASLARIVMLAPPNQGSPVATFLSKRVVPCCRTLAQLTDDQQGFVINLPEPEGLEIGIVAGVRDRVIPDSSSRLRNQTDRVSVNSGHNGLLVRPAAIRQVIRFLNDGRFHENTNDAVINRKG